MDIENSHKIGANQSEGFTASGHDRILPEPSKDCLTLQQLLDQRSELLEVCQMLINYPEHIKNIQGYSVFIKNIKQAIDNTESDMKKG